MNEHNSVFSEKTLSLLYRYFDVEKAEDPIFQELYNSLSKWLVAIDNNRDNIITHVIHSNKTQNFVVPKIEENKFFLVWDVSFWHFYTDFLLVFFSYESLMYDDFLDKATKERLLNNTTSFLKNSILNFLVARFSKNKDATDTFFSLKNVYYKSSEIHTNDKMMQIIQSIVAISKEFVLMHEFEHILYHISPEIYAKDTSVFDSILTYYHDTLIDHIDTDKTRISSVQFKRIVNSILKNKDEKQYSELYSDYHAFFEILLHNGENFQNKNLDFSKNIPNYLFAIKLLKIFSSCINYTTQIIDSVLTTKFQKRTKREKRIVDAYLEYQKTVYARDYLSIELFAVTLMLYAKEFPINLKNFAKSINTRSFVLPYTQIIQLKFNEFINEVANRLVLAVK